MSTLELVLGFLAVAITQLLGFGSTWLQTRANHTDNGKRLDALAAALEDHLSTDHGGLS